MRGRGGHASGPNIEYSAKLEQGSFSLENSLRLTSYNISNFLWWHSVPSSWHSQQNKSILTVYEYVENLGFVWSSPFYFAPYFGECLDKVDGLAKRSLIECPCNICANIVLFGIYFLNIAIILDMAKILWFWIQKGHQITTFYL